VGLAVVRAPRGGGRAGAVRRAPLALALLAALGLACVPGAAHAHDAPYSFLNLRFTPRGVEGSLTCHVFDLAHESGLVTPESLLAPAFARSAAPALWRTLAARLSLVADGDTLRPVFVSAEPDSERRGVAFRFRAEAASVPERVAVDARLFPYDAQHETYVNAYVGGALKDQDLIDAKHPHIEFATGARTPTLTVVRRFVAAGIHHIYIGPDHILFIVGLLLLGGSLGRLLKIVTGFTIAHSITLALATFGVVHPPSRVVEPVIALSIIFVGIENIRALRAQAPGAAAPRDRRALLAFLFGFVHGFGFASVLRDFGLPQGAMAVALVSFNLGVEIGQASIVLVTAPLLAALRRASAPAGRRFAYAGSAAVCAAGGFWLVQRVFFAH
jgi:hypothetical protein